MVKQKFKDKQRILEAISIPFAETKSLIKGRLSDMQNFEEHLIDLVNNGYIEKKVSDRDKTIVLYAISDKGRIAHINNEFIEQGEKEALEENMKKTQIFGIKTTLFYGGISAVSVIVSLILIYSKC